jgi:hypothetical protein
MDFDDLILKWLKPLLDKGFSRIILSGGTSAHVQDSRLKTIVQLRSDRFYPIFILLGIAARRICP